MVPHHTCPVAQVEVWPQGLSAIAPEALLVERQEVKGLNSIILSKVGLCWDVRCYVL